MGMKLPEEAKTLEEVEKDFSGFLDELQKEEKAISIPGEGSNSAVLWTSRPGKRSSASLI